MDALALGPLFLDFSSLCMWRVQSYKRWLRLAALRLGLVSSGFFVIGLRWLF